MHALATRTLDAGIRALAQANALLLGDPPEDRDEQGADRAARIEPLLAHADDLDPTAIEVEHRLDVAHRGATEPIEGPHDEHVELALVGVVHHARVLGPLSMCAPAPRTG